MGSNTLQIFSVDIDWNLPRKQKRNVDNLVYNLYCCAITCFFSFTRSFFQKKSCIHFFELKFQWLKKASCQIKIIHDSCRKSSVNRKWNLSDDLIVRKNNYYWCKWIFPGGSFNWNSISFVFCFAAM